MKALSIRQPWCDAILFGNKRVENRDWKHGSNFRGRFLLHASKGMTRGEYEDACWFMEARSITWRPRPIKELVRGAIVGAATVSAVLKPGSPFRDPWYLGNFALVLTDVVAFANPIPYTGSLGFFDVPELSGMPCLLCGKDLSLGEYHSKYVGHTVYGPEFACGPFDDIPFQPKPGAAGVIIGLK